MDITTPVGVVVVVRHTQTEDMTQHINAAVEMLPQSAWVRLSENTLPDELTGTLEQVSSQHAVVALFVTTNPLVVQATLPVTGEPLAFRLATVFGDLRYSVRVFVPDEECAELHVTVNTLAYVEQWRHQTSDSAVLLHKLRQFPFIWKRVCLHYEEGDSLTVPRICDRNNQCVVGLDACKKFLHDLEV